MIQTVEAANSGYRFMPGVSQYSCGVGALPGFTLERVEEPGASRLLAEQQPEYAAVPIFLSVAVTAWLYLAALAWALAVSPNVLLIPGTSSVRHLRENLAASNVELDADAIRRLSTP